jgi:hypothetical protein
MRLLVLTSETITAEQLREALPAEVDPSEAQVMVVAPALQRDFLHFWLSDADAAIDEAEKTRRQTIDKLDSSGVQASGDTGESDPIEAIADALQTFQADRIVLFTRAGSEQRYREDIDPAQIEDRFGIPVDHASL